MERTCVCCKKTVQNLEDMQFCPYCGTPMTQTNMVRAQDNIAWKIETTWGNQAIYADKVKRVCRDLVARINAWVAEQESFSAEPNPAQFVTKQQLWDDFAFLRSAPNTEELEHEYQSFMRLLRDVCSGKKILRSERTVYVDLDMCIQENLHLFEAIVGVSANINLAEGSKDANATIQAKNGTVDFGEVFAVLDKAFESVKMIIQNQGYLCVQNCDFDPAALRMLNKYSFVDNHGMLCCDLRDVIAALNTSCAHDFADLFDDQYENHLVMFFESLWVVFQSILARFLPETQSEDRPNCWGYAEEWLAYMEVAIDRAKCYPDADMIEMYLAAQKACNIVKKNFT